MRVGRPHGLDGSFYVDAPAHPLPEGTVVTVGALTAEVVRRAGTDARPIVRLTGVDDRDAAAGLRGLTLDAGQEEPPDEGEWLVEDLVGCRIEGLGVVTRVLAGPSCDVLEVGEDGHLVPLVTDAVRRVDVEGKAIEVDREFLAL